MINRLIANDLRVHLASLPFIEVSAGLVQTIEKKERVEQNWKIQRFPASLDVNGWDSETNYFPLVPDSKYKGMAYFEDMGTIGQGRNRSGLQFASKLRLIVWYNESLAGLEAPYTAASVLASLPEHISCNGILTRSNVSVLRLPTAEENLFSKYTYDEAVNQYLMKPFTAFGVDLEVSYTLNVGHVTV
jgi:hypothetical protein